MNAGLIKIYFTDFPHDFDPENNYFINLLKKKYTVILSPNPEILFFSNYGQRHLRFSCHKIFYSSENIRPDFNLADFAFSFTYGGEPKNYRLPLYVLHANLETIIKPRNIDEIIRSKNKFCNFIYSNGKAKERIHFFELLSKYKKVDAPGRLLNNVGDPAGMHYDYQWKSKFIEPYKFTIAFENSSFPGYTTEKIIHPILVNSMPIYWGNPRIAEEFNTRSFINVHEYSSFEEAVEEIIRIDKDEELYRKYLTEPYFINNEIPLALRDESILKQLALIVSSIGVSSPVSSSLLGIYHSRIKFIEPFMKKIKRYLIKGPSNSSENSNL